jgi:hypothetical protein
LPTKKGENEKCVEDGFQTRATLMLLKTGLFSSSLSIERERTCQAKKNNYKIFLEESKGTRCLTINLTIGAPSFLLENIYNLRYAFSMDEDIIFKPTAFRHGVSEADISHAFDHPRYDHVMPDETDKNLLIGFDRNGNPLEILYNVLDGNTINVFHAMKCRKTYRALVNL